MVSIARKNLFQEKTRLAISVCGVGIAIMLVLIVSGLYLEAEASAARYVMNAGADLWVTKEGATSLYGPTWFPSSLKENLSQIEGVKEVGGLISRHLSIPVNEKHVTASILGYDTQTGLGGPWRISEGASKPAENEAIIDRVFARRNGFEVGSKIEIMNQEFTVVGISEETNILFAAQYIFISDNDAARIFSEGGKNLFVVSVDGSSSIAEVANRIEENIDGVTAHTKENFARNSQQAIVTNFLPLVLAVVVIGLVVGIVVTSLTVYTATIEKIREYGILKAIGARNTHLYKIVMEQTFVTSVFGFMAGVVFLMMMNHALEWFIPGWATFISASLLGAVFLLACFMSLVASYLPIRRMAKIDPAIVFKV